MGFPGLWSWFERTFSCSRSLPRQVDDLYIEVNHLLHRALESSETEDLFYSIVLERIDHIVNTVMPSRMVYLTVDGVAPFAKMKTQRARRFRRGPTPHLDANSITPGTRLMEGLLKTLRWYAVSKLNGTRFGQTVCIVVDGPDVPGEGEAKVCRVIEHQPEVQGRQITSLIVSPDADLILYALLSKHNEIYICKDIQKNNCLSTGVLRERIVLRATQGIEKSDASFHRERIVCDIAVLFSLVQNDFLPTLDGIDSRKSQTLTELFTMYIEGFIGHWVDPQENILHIERMLPFFQYCARNATAVLPLKRLAESEDSEDFISLVNPAPKLSTKFHIRSHATEATVLEYLRGCTWVVGLILHRTPPSWTWTYSYESAPPAAQLADTSLLKRLALTVSYQGFSPSEPPSPFLQLLLVLPRHSLTCLPDTYRKLVSDSPTWIAQCERPEWGNPKPLQELASSMQQNLSLNERTFSQEGIAVLFSSDENSFSQEIREISSLRGSSSKDDRKYNASSNFSTVEEFIKIKSTMHVLREEICCFEDAKRMKPTELPGLDDLSKEDVSLLRSGARKNVLHDQAKTPRSRLYFSRANPKAMVNYRIVLTDVDQVPSLGETSLNNTRPEVQKVKNQTATFPIVPIDQAMRHWVLFEGPPRGLICPSFIEYLPWHGRAKCEDFVLPSFVHPVIEVCRVVHVGLQMPKEAPILNSSVPRTSKDETETLDRSTLGNPRTAPYHLNDSFLLVPPEASDKVKHQATDLLRRLQGRKKVES